ncbi:hypothetical protein ACQJBY_052957 [Aegilops geniculata]
MRLVLCAALIAAAGVISSAGADDAFLLAHHDDGAAATGRSRRLPQTRRACPVDFTAANYTVLTSRCRWPPFDLVQCCAAFKDFACPYADYINDVNGTDCAAVMFHYIDLHGGYPPGVFYLNCREGHNKGLKCPDGIHSYRPSTPPPPRHP